MTNVTLNKLQYRAGIKTALKLETEIQQYPVESGYSVSDNLKHQPATFELEIILGGAELTGGRGKDTEYLELKGLQASGIPFYFLCDFGAFDNMVITSVSPAQELSLNTYSCTVSITEIKFATLTTKSFNVTDTDGHVIYAEAKPGGIPATQELVEKASLIGDIIQASIDMEAAASDFGISAKDAIINTLDYVFSLPPEKRKL